MLTVSSTVVSTLPTHVSGSSSLFPWHSLSARDLAAALSACKGGPPGFLASAPQAERLTGLVLQGAVIAQSLPSAAAQLFLGMCIGPPSASLLGTSQCWASPRLAHCACILRAETSGPRASSCHHGEQIRHSSYLHGGSNPFGGDRRDVIKSAMSISIIQNCRVLWQQIVRGPSWPREQESLPGRGT